MTRDIEVTNNLKIARGEWGGDSGERGLQELKGHMDYILFNFIWTRKY